MAIALLDDALRTMDRVLVDTSAMIAFHNVREPAHPLATHLMRRIENGADPLRGYYSVVSAAEIMVRPIRTSMADFTYMHTFLTGFPNLAILPVDMPVATQAATIRAATNIRMPDALIVASGLLSGCQAIISNDQPWQSRLSPLFPAFAWLYLGDYV